MQDPVLDTAVRQAEEASTLEMAHVAMLEEAMAHGDVDDAVVLTQLDHLYLNGRRRLDNLRELVRVARDRDLDRIRATWFPEMSLT